MIKFILKGLLRDKHRSLIPFLVTAIGVMLTVVFHAWITGVLGNSIEFNAKFSAGHVKIMTRAYAEMPRNRLMISHYLALIHWQELLLRSFQGLNLFSEYISVALLMRPVRTVKQCHRVMPWALE